MSFRERGWLALLASGSVGLGVAVALLTTSPGWWDQAPMSTTLPWHGTPAPSPPPPRDQIAVFQPEQTLVLTSKTGGSQVIAYTSMILDPRWIDLHYFDGWSREQEANNDAEALLFFTGPTFEKGHPDAPHGMVLHGDLKLSDQQIKAGNRAAAAQRAFIAVGFDGSLEFGFGSFSDVLDQKYRLFIGGLHAFSLPAVTPPPTYAGVYGPMAMADVRIVYGLRSDGRLEVIETADGVLFPDLKRFVEAKGFVASFLPDHASKSRLIVPGQRLWSETQAEWVSGGKPSITALPFMLRVVPRSML